MEKEFIVTCLVNDCVLFGSNYWAEHGQSFLIETKGGKILFDTGMTSKIISHNLRVSKKNIRDLNSIAISHGHNDHTGGLRWVVEEVNNPIIYGAPELFEEKWIKREGVYEEIGIPFTQELLAEKAKIILSHNEIELLPGVYLSGEIPRIYDEESADPDNWLEKDENGLIDEFPDDRSLILEKDEGLIILTGCCHAGLINTIDYSIKLLSKPVLAIVGGNHLINSTTDKLEWTFKQLQKHKIPKLLFNHCVGLNVYSKLLVEFPNVTHYFYSGDIASL